MRMYRKLSLIILALLVLSAVSAPLVGAVGATTLQLKLEVDKKEILLNGSASEWETAPVAVNNKVYVPLKAIGNTVGAKVEWNDSTKKVELTVPKLKIYFNIDQQQLEINGLTLPLDSVAMMNEGTLMVRYNWFADIIGAKADYDAAAKTIQILYTKLPDDLMAGDSDNSRPVAKFTFGKSSYKLGEPVKYIDLSYDPDAEGIANYEWTGKKDAFYTPGQYKISLKVTDGNGHASSVYTRTLTIERNTYASPLEYKLNFTPVGTSFKTDWSEIWGNFWELPNLKKQVVEDKSRKLIVSDSPETIKEKGILYQEKVNGKARLYADHVNGMEDTVQFVIMARNTNPSKPVTIKTSNKGEVFPSIYANLIGHEASVDFMLKDPVDHASLTIPAGQGFTYVRMPDFYPGQGVNVFYDVETDGEVEFSFVAMDHNISTPMPSLLGFMKHLDFAGNVRGTFPVSDIAWNVDGKDITKPLRLTIGDGKDDPFVKGYDVQRKKEVLNEGNYGMIYNIHMVKPPKMAVLLLAEGGPFKGPFKINGEFAMVPNSGVLEAFKNVQVLARTTGTEDKLDLEFTPPAGSAFPVDLIFYPLKDLK